MVSMVSVVSSSPSRSGRRRQRSVRVTVAVALLGLATAVVVVALPTQSPLWLSVAAVLALVCGVAASRIVYTELVQSRRDANADRAAQAQAYRSMFAERASEHAEFTTAMTDRLTRREHEVAELTEMVARLERQRAAQADKPDEPEEVAVWDASSLGEGDPVADLIAWEQRVSATASTADDAPARERA